jgi:hypothetical protein
MLPAGHPRRHSETQRRDCILPKLQRSTRYLVAALLVALPVSAHASAIGDTMDFLGLSHTAAPAAASPAADPAPAHAGLFGNAIGFLGLGETAQKSETPVPGPAADAAPAHKDLLGNAMGFLGLGTAAQKSQAAPVAVEQPAAAAEQSASYQPAPALVIPARAVAARPIFTARSAELAELATPSLPTVAVAELPTPSVETPLHRLFCVEYARARSGLAIIGDAKLWWARAKNLYARASNPISDAVMVFSGSSRLKRGHVAVVTNIVSAREIRVDQANWQNHGEIDHSTPVLDVSKNNDWSQVRVWDIRSRTFGAHVYAISGFIAKGLVQRADAE